MRALRFKRATLQVPRKRLDDRRYRAHFAVLEKHLKLCNIHKNENIFQQCVNFVAIFFNECV